MVTIEQVMEFVDRLDGYGMVITDYDDLNEAIRNEWPPTGIEDNDEDS